MFALQPKPTFKIDVTIPAATGGGTIKFEFNHKGRKALREFFEALTDAEANRDDAEVLCDLVAGWSGVDQPFTKENFETLLDNYPGAAAAIFAAYNTGIVEGKAKN